MFKLSSIRILKKNNGPSSGPKEVAPKVKEVPDTEGAIDKLNSEVLSTISNKEFLRVDRNSRLEHITNPSKKAPELSEGDVVNITFTFNGKLNRDLFLRTTAGQVMPEGVNTLEAYGTLWTRNGLSGEFFSASGNRLIIRDGSALSIKKTQSKSELASQIAQIETSAEPFKSNKDHDLILAGLKRNIPAETALTLFSKQLEEITDTQKRKYAIEEMITEFERTKDSFYEDYAKNALKDNALRPEFIAYYTNHTAQILSIEDKKNLGITEDLEKNFSRKARAQVFAGFRGMEELSPAEKEKLSDIPTDILEGWKSENFGMKFIPGSKECQQLFTCAAVLAGLPSEWGSDENLHRILSKESAGVVGRVNYTLVAKGVDGLGLKRIAKENAGLEGSSIAGKVGVISTATGLGQLTLSNEKYLPHGRDSIGIPLEEAIGMLRYIKDRYGSPEVAGSIYGRTGTYTHAITGQILPKQFEEGY